MNGKLRGGALVAKQFLTAFALGCFFGLTNESGLFSARSHGNLSYFYEFEALDIP